MLMSVIQEEDKEFVINTIMSTARSGAKGAFGDGKIFISDVECAYTISSGVKEERTEVRRLKEVLAIVRINMMNENPQGVDRGWSGCVRPRGQRQGGWILIPRPWPAPRRI